MQTDRKQLIKIILAFGAVYIIWGTTYLAIRIAVTTIPPFLMAGVRFVVGGLIIFLFLRARGTPVPDRRHWLPAAVVGTLLLAGGSGLVTWAEQEVPSGIASLIIATVPLWFALLDWLFFHSRRPGKRVIFGLLLGFIGIALLIGPQQFLGPSQFPWLSLLLLLLSPILWSIGSLYSRQADLPPDTFMSTALQMLAAGVVLFTAGFLTGEARQLDFAAISTRSLLALVYLTLFGSIVAFTAYVWLLQNVQATKVATYAYVNPVIAVFLGWLILDERVTPLMITAVAIIILSVILITTRSKEDRIPGLETAVPEAPAVSPPIE
jgi:drug/metabolite transporter (DMT)-like permease